MIAPRQAIKCISYVGFPRPIDEEGVRNFVNYVCESIRYGNGFEYFGFLHDEDNTLKEDPVGGFSGKFFRLRGDHQDFPVEGVPDHDRSDLFSGIAFERVRDSNWKISIGESKILRSVESCVPVFFEESDGDD